MKFICKYLVSLMFALCTMSVTAQTFNLSNCEVRFSPKGNIDSLIIETIDSSYSTIRVLAYSFTRREIAEALVRAHLRGVNVQVILDRSNIRYQYSQYPLLYEVGVPTYFDSKHAIAHNKVILIDKDRIMTGSYNFSASAEDRNGENYLRCTSREAYRQYLLNWDLHKSHSVEGSFDQLYFPQVN